MERFKKIAIVTHPHISDAVPIAKRMAAALRAHGADAEHGPLEESPLLNALAQGQFDLCIAMGGDGTMLRCGQICGPAGIPVLGINLGRLGFLMAIQVEEWESRLPQLLEGAFWLEPRMMLFAVHTRAGKVLGEWDVLNEAIVSRGDVVRPVQLNTSLDGTALTTYHADGLIAATPTGSTAYALAVGGPILPPDLRNFLIVPIAPHFSFASAIVLAEGTVVTIRVGTHHKATLSLDGQLTVPLLDGDEVLVRASKHSVEFVRFQEADYFYRNLTSKMNANFKDD